MNSRSVGLTGKHIHHALCGHGGYELESQAIYQFYGCWWHETICIPKKKRNLGKYNETFRQGKRFTAKELRMVGVCKCEVGQYVLKKSEIFTVNLLTLHNLSLLLTTHMSLYQDGVNTEKAAQLTLLKRYY